MVGTAEAPVVAVLTRAPSTGGKSRLFAALDRPPDPALLAALLLDTLDAVTSSQVACVIAVEPAVACDDVRALLDVPGSGHPVRVLPQPTGSLGDRMREIMRARFDEGATRVALVGSDVPLLTADAIADAFDRLHHAENVLVLGPALDGGYYLIAAARVPEVFDGIEWGSPRVLEQTIAAAVASGMTVELLAPLCDIDTVEDLTELARTAAPPRAQRTIAWARANGH